MRRRILSALIPLLVSAPGLADAQTIVGRLEEEGGGPLRTAFVVLQDAAGRDRGSILTDTLGRFVLRAPHAGDYTLRIEQIGRRTTTSDTIRVAEGESRPFHMLVPRSAIQLASLTVSADRKCEIRPKEGLITATLWEEARKALTLAGWGDDQALHTFMLRRYEREYDPVTGAVRAETVDSTVGRAAAPIRSLPAEVLMREGFVRTDEGVARFYGPDATVLLSDIFLDTHCLQPRVHPERADLIGIAFEPAPGRKLPDIQGVLWLDRNSAELRFLEFEYRNLPYGIGSTFRPRLPFGGHAEFDRLPTGAWIIRSWWLRGPRIAVRAVPQSEVQVGASTRRSRGTSVAPGATRQHTIVGVREDGQEIVRVLPPRVAASIGPGALTGLVFDTTGLLPLAGARVYLSGTVHSTRADSLGRYRFDELPPGHYRAAIEHAGLAARGLLPNPRPATVVSGAATVTVLVAGPARLQIPTSAATAELAQLHRRISAASSIEELELIRGTVNFPEGTAARLASNGVIALRLYEIGRNPTDAQQARYALQSSLERDPRLAWAHYALGLSWIRAPGVRTRAWRADDEALPAREVAINSLQRAIEADPTLVDAALVIADIAMELRSPAELDEARAALDRVLRTGSDDARLHRARAEVEIARGSYAEAAGAATRAVVLAGDATAFRLLGIARLRQGHEKEGANAYFAGIARADEAALARYFEEIEPVASLSEKMQWQAAKFLERRSWLRRFWETRAAQDGVTVASRLAAHYERLAAAYSRYFNPVRQGSAPIRAVFRRSPSERVLPLDDRGVLLLRHGEPDTILRTLTGDDLLPNETWVYHFPERKQPTLFPFVATGTASGFWLLDDILHAVDWSGTGSQQGTLLDGVHDGKPGGKLDAAAGLLRDLATVDPRYGLLAVRIERLRSTAATTAPPSDTAALSDAQRMAARLGQDIYLEAQTIASELRNAQTAAYLTDSHRSFFERALPVVYDLITFRSRDGGTESIVPVAIGGAGLVPDTSGGQATYAVAVTMTLGGLDGNVAIVDTLYRVSSERPLRPGENIRLYLPVRNAPAGGVQQRLTARDANAPGTGITVGGPAEVPSFRGAALSISDLAFSEPGDDGRLRRGSAAIELVPGRRFAAGAEFRLFYELYGLGPGAEYTTRLSLERSEANGAWATVDRLLGRSGAPIAVEFDAVAAPEPDGVVRELRTLQPELEPGRYRLTVTVTDTSGAATALRSGVFHIH